MQDATNDMVFIDVWHVPRADSPAHKYPFGGNAGFLEAGFGTAEMGTWFQSYDSPSTRGLTNAPYLCDESWPLSRYLTPQIDDHFLRQVVAGRSSQRRGSTHCPRAC